jgi:hypothetical protein
VPPTLSLNQGILKKIRLRNNCYSRSRQTFRVSMGQLSASSLTEKLSCLIHGDESHRLDLTAG